MKSRKSFLLRLDPALYEALDNWAQQELRSVNGQIEYVLKQAVLARDRKALPPDSADSPQSPAHEAVRDSVQPPAASNEA